MVQAITQEPIVGKPAEPGQEHDRVRRVRRDSPGTEALLHISEMRHGRTEDRGRGQEGDRVKVKLIDRDERGRLRLDEGTAAEAGGRGGGSAVRAERAASAVTAAIAGREPIGAAAGEGDEPSYSAQAGTEGEESSERGERSDRPRRPRGRGGRGGRGGRDRE